MSRTDRTHRDYFQDIPVWLAIKFMGKDDPSNSTTDQRKREWRKRQWKREIEFDSNLAQW